MNPSEEQIKRFWEYFGFKFVETASGKKIGKLFDADVIDSCVVAVYPDGYRDTEHPVIDLNNLFKYAVPKLTIEDDWVWEMLQEWFYNAMRNSNYRKDSVKSALALFWAINKVIEDATK